MNRKEDIMRNVLTLGIAAVVLVSTAVALAQGTRWAWTEPKAERIVAQDATVRLQRSDRTLEAELQASVRLYGGLALAAQETNDPKAAQFRSLASRFSKALAVVRNGVTIDAAACKGTGTAKQGRRFRHFRCAARSELLGIPSVELSGLGTEELPTVIEGPPRILGPWRAQLDVRVNGRSAMKYRQVGIATLSFPAS
jgi:hypothetical protein